MIEFLNWSGNVPVESDKFMMLVMVGIKTDEHFLRKLVRIGWSSQNLSGHELRHFRISSCDTGRKCEKTAGERGGKGWCGDVVALKLD